MDNNNLNEKTSVPVPKPRRHNLNSDVNLNNKTSYENVSIDLINKNIYIKDENLQNNSKNNKLQTNKLFLVPTTSSNLDNDTTSSSPHPLLTNLNDLANASSEIKKNASSHLDEVNKLSNIYNDDENANVKPVPAPRRSSSATRMGKIVSSKINCSPSTGAINKQPNKLYNDCIDDSPKSNRKGSKSSGSYSFMHDDVDSESLSSKFGLKKTHSNSSLSSSRSEASTNDGLNLKYNSTSPGQLLKVLGTTSKLLSESITERVTTRTRDAKDKIDRIHKSSRDRIAETTKSAKNKMRSVRKNINDTIEMTQNLSIGRKKTNSMNKSDNKSKVAAFDLDRPQTVPPNDELFSSISFHSPLNIKTNKCMNINSSESSYEIPKSLRSLSSDSSAFSEQPGISSNPPPSYDEVIIEKNLEEKLNLQPNPARNRRRGKTDSNTYENHEIRISPANDSSNKGGSKLTVQSSDSSEDEGNASLPCPNFPAPVFTDGIYGQIRAKPEVELSSGAQPLAPVRSKRRKDYEPIDLKNGNEIVDSNRATAGSNELKLEDKYSKLVGEDFSEELTKELREIEAKMSKVDRSESWSYYDANSDRSDELSSPEPIYENDQNTRKQVVEEELVPIYGVIYSPEDSTASTLLTPEITRKRRLTERLSGGYAKVNKIPDVKLRNDEIPTDILKEFDPLDRKTLDKILGNKSNELILLESILGGETYGNCVEENNYDYNSTESSDREESEGIPTPPERLDSLKDQTSQTSFMLFKKEGNKESEVIEQSNSNEENNFSNENRISVIIHQNSNLRSESSENIVDDVSNENGGSASNTVESKTSQTRWFMGTSSKSESKSKSKKREEKASNVAGDDNKVMTPLSKTSSMKSMFSNVMNRVEGIKRKTSFRSQPAKNEVKTILEMIPRPCLTQRLILHEGHLIRLPSGVVEDILKELHSRKAYIRDKKFQAYFDKDLKTPKENIPLEWITTIQCVQNYKFSNNFLDIYCFEITTAIPKNTSNNLSNPNMVITTNNSGNTKSQRVCHLYGVAKESERFIWMQKLLESLTDVFPPGFSCHFYRAGWCYSKNSITSTWSGTWVLLQKEKRRLLFYNHLDMNLECMDLRKARCMVLKESDDSIKNLRVESGPTLMIDCPPYSMYFIMVSPRETKIWRHIIQEIAHNNGPSLKEQQLTKDNVPVLVDKCINFIYTHGSMSEGIYRKSGSEASIQKLLKKFRSDAYSTQIIRNEYSEHDAANVLKRFMRDLPDRLLGRYTVSFVSVSKMKEPRERVEAYKELLTRLPSIEYHTLRKLLGHLHFIQSQNVRNKMNFANLAIVWGPTLLQEVETNQQYSQKSVDVIIDLIKFYKNLYALSPDEILKEQLMLAVLQKYHAAAENLTDTMKKSGDLKVWITIDPNPEDDKEEKQQINVTLTPTKTVNDICKELAPKLNRESFTVTLSEIILNDSLQRPLHHDDKAFDIVLKWSYWPEGDRKNNYLRLTPIQFMKDVERALKVLPSMSPNKELKFADNKTKSFKSYTLELTGHTITVMKKEKNTITKVREMDLKKMTAYLGCEKKRDFQLRWAITLIEDCTANKTNAKSRETPFIGHVIAGTNSNDQIIWYSSILHSLYSDNIFPKPEILLP